MPTFLQLAPEQGGNRFGPFAPGAIQLGSDPKRCQIALGVAGIAPVHATIMDHGNGTFTVAPTQRGLALLVVQNGAFRTCDGPVNCKSGDQVLVGGHTGAKFTLVFEMGRGGGRSMASAGAPMASGPIAGPTQSAGGGVGGMFGSSSAGRRYERQGGFGNAMVNEAKRQVMAKALARMGLGEFYTMWYRWQSGSLLNPRFVISALSGLIVVFGGALVSCMGLVTAWFAAH